MSARNESRQEAFDRAIRRLSVCIKLLSAVLLALLARILLDGINLPIGLTTAVLLLLLGASLAMWRHGQRLQRALSHQRLNNSAGKLPSHRA